MENEDLETSENFEDNEEEAAVSDAVPPKTSAPAPAPSGGANPPRNKTKKKKRQKVRLIYVVWCVKLLCHQVKYQLTRIARVYAFWGEMEN